MTKPLWLSDAGVRHLLNAIVDQIERAELAGKTLARSISLNERNYPALYGASLESEKERYWGYIPEMARLGWIELKLGKSHPGMVGYERSPRLVIKDASRFKEATGRLHREVPASELWRAAVDKVLDLPQDVRNIIYMYRLDISGRDPEEVAMQLAKLPSLKDESLLLREVSSQLFWGMSKLLDDRQKLVAAIMGLEECPFPEMPVHIQVALPKGGFDGVLFIENSTNYDRAMIDSVLGGKFERLALVFSAGFKAGAKRLRTKIGSSVYMAVEGSLDSVDTKRFMEWFYGRIELPNWFWGDLDYAGMSILAALRQSFHDIDAWEPGYRPMMDRLKNGFGHAPEATNKEKQKPISHTGCRYADQFLIPALQETEAFIDQEGFV